MFSTLLRWRRCAALCLCFSVSPLVQAGPLTETELVQQFEQEFRTKLQQAKVPGGAYAIVQGERIVKLGQYGVKSGRRACHCQCRYGIPASLSVENLCWSQSGAGRTRESVTATTAVVELRA